MSQHNRTSDVGFVISVFASKTDNQPKQASFESFKAFVEHLVKEGHEVRKDKDGEGFSPVSYRAGTTRGKYNVDLAYGVGLDFDHVTEEQIHTALEKLDGLEYVAYTTFSHTEAEPRLRVIVALAKPIPAQAFPAVWQHLHQLTGSISDESCKDVSRFFYSPARPE